jgi:hypothetical protein
MSYSVSNLIRNMAIKNPVTPETKLDNPDIPDMDSVIRNRQFIKDQAYNSLRFKTGPRNGDGDLLPRNSFRPDNPKLDAFLMDRSIDPDVIRQRQNPTTMAAPVWNTEGLLYGIDPTMNTSKDSTDLIQKARNNYYNYTNRFNVDTPDSTIPSMTYNPNIPDIPNIPNNSTIPDIPTKQPIYTRQVMVLNPDGSSTLHTNKP